MRSWQPTPTAAGIWVQQPSEVDLSKALTASSVGNFSHLEESVFHIGGLIRGGCPLLGNFGQPGGANLLPGDYAMLPPTL